MKTMGVTGPLVFGPAELLQRTRLAQGLELLYLPGGSFRKSLLSHGGAGERLRVGVATGFTASGLVVGSTPVELCPGMLQTDATSY